MKKQKFQKVLGQRVKDLRRRQCITQTELAFKCGCEKSNMSRLESGNTNPTSYTLYIVAQQLGVPLHELFIFEQ